MSEKLQSCSQKVFTFGTVPDHDTSGERVACMAGRRFDRVVFRFADHARLKLLASEHWVRRQLFSANEGMCYQVPQVAEKAVGGVMQAQTTGVFIGRTCYVTHVDKQAGEQKSY